LKFYDSLGPNPRLVRLFLAEKGIDVPKVQVDLMGGENRRAPYTDKNPGGQLPTLELDDGTFLAETVPICEYLEELHPQPPLMGETPAARGAARMWTRRVELWITEPLTAGFRYAEGLGLFKGRIRTIPQAADDLKALARDGLVKLDGLMAGRTFVAGSRLTLADLVLYSFLDFGASVGQPVDPALRNVSAWFARMAARPSAEASLHPVARAVKMRG
jgi:glutathione S-transferase